MSYRESLGNLREFNRDLVDRTATWKLLLVGLPVLFLVVFFGLAVGVIFVFSFWRTEQFQLYADWNIANYVNILTSSSYHTLIVRSVGMALLVTFVCLVLGYPIAYYIARGMDDHQLPVLLLFAAPFFVGEMLRESAHQALIGPSGLANQLLKAVGIGSMDIFGYGLFQVFLGEVYLWFPFMVLSIFLSLTLVDFTLLDAAIDAGASRAIAFKEVTWPLSLPGAAIGSILVFVSTLVSHVPSRFVGGPGGSLIGNILKDLFGESGAWAQGSALGVVLLVIAMLFVTLVIAYTVRQVPTILVGDAE